MVDAQPVLIDEAAAREAALDSEGVYAYLKARDPQSVSCGGYGAGGYAHIPLLCVQCADLCLHVGFVVAQADTLRWLSSSSSCCTATQRKGRLPKALSTLPPSKAALPRYTRQLVPSCDRARITSLAHTTVLPVPDCNSWHKQSTKYKTPTKPCVELSAMRLA